METIEHIGIFMGIKAIENITNDLVDQGLITEDQLAVAKTTQQSLGGDLADILINKGFITEKKILRLLGKKLSLSVVSLSNYNINFTTTKLLPEFYAKKWNVIPLFEVEDKVIVAVSDPMNLEALDEIRSVMKHQVDPVLASEMEIRDAIREHYRGSDLLDTGGDVDVDVVKYAVEENDPNQNVVDIAKEASGKQVVRTLNNILHRAYEEKASDLHLEPSQRGLKVRLRIDGALEELQVLPQTMHMPIISRIKIIAGIDVAERRIPQDGRVRLNIDHKPIDLRINTYPTMYGEAAAIRLLAQENLMSMGDLGFLEKDRGIFEELITKPQGILLVTGPTGSGKTKTLYAAMQRINSPDRHVLSIEDPIEHEIENVAQTQVHVKSGMTFATALRAMLRQDPDIIMVGEIRDFETADISIRAAMTGHMVFSTLHTNTAVGAISRLVDLKLEPYLIADTLVGVMAQRLVRRICKMCKTEVALTDEQRLLLKEKAMGLKSYRGVGCKHCRHSGYNGRIGLFEIFQVDDEIRVLIYKKCLDVRIVEKLRSSSNYHSLFEDGLEKIRQGITSIDEVLKVVKGGINS